ncbi:DUF1643 domain-containing protein [Horticoccus luteus]|uniref:DUF1643 domain-containing protein n=1 Tax=Horticoccus luteus TaxID=2862869 RepID=A0A8F9TU22_9BACT|nr:DUF1643 domain-containing protein [Horticoccus luteus]QYM78125.1 DUF1643 domain-containing protein [Horticoccus luteus]
MMRNDCVFSRDRRYRYTLIHRWDELLNPERGIAWICLNPSTADENQLDPTLRRIRAFSAAWGYGYFVMLNAFAWRATLPADMKRVADPVGPDNDRWIAHWAARVDRVMLGWGEHGAHLGRDRAVLRLLNPANTFCLQRNASTQPKHPLYVAQATPPAPFAFPALEAPPQ